MSANMCVCVVVHNWLPNYADRGSNSVELTTPKWGVWKKKFLNIKIKNKSPKIVQKEIGKHRKVLKQNVFIFYLLKNIQKNLSIPKRYTYIKTFKQTKSKNQNFILKSKTKLK